MQHSTLKATPLKTTRLRKQLYSISSFLISSTKLACSLRKLSSLTLRYSFIWFCFKSHSKGRIARSNESNCTRNSKILSAATSKTRKPYLYKCLELTTHKNAGKDSLKSCHHNSNCRAAPSYPLR